jgi:hypothetical protein
LLLLLIENWPLDHVSRKMFIFLDKGLIRYYTNAFPSHTCRKTKKIRVKAKEQKFPIYIKDLYSIASGAYPWETHLLIPLPLTLACALPRTPLATPLILPWTA